MLVYITCSDVKESPFWVFLDEMARELDTRIVSSQEKTSPDANSLATIVQVVIELNPIMTIDDITELVLGIRRVYPTVLCSDPYWGENCFQ
jgi:ABC-type transporter MlaC component